MSRVGTWWLTQACEDAARWQRDTRPHRSTGSERVSLPADGGRFVADVTAVLSATGLDPTTLVLEVTENVLIEDSDLALLVLLDLKGLGIRVALDDFGTGYSSLSYLHGCPIDIVKIDQSFVANIERASRGGAIVAAVTNLAHALSLLVVPRGSRPSGSRTS